MDLETLAPPPLITFSTDRCLYDAVSTTLYGYLTDDDTDAVVYPEWVAIQSHITGARYILGMDEELNKENTQNGFSYVFKRDNSQKLYFSLNRFILFKTRKQMIQAFNSAKQNDMMQLRSVGKHSRATAGDSIV